MGSKEWEEWGPGNASVDLWSGWHLKGRMYTYTQVWVHQTVYWCIISTVPYDSIYKGFYIFHLFKSLFYNES